MVINNLHLLVVVLIVFWLAVIYDISKQSREKGHQEEKDDKRHWPFHHA